VVSCPDLGYVAYSGHFPYKVNNGECVKSVQLNCKNAERGGGVWTDPTDAVFGVGDLACKRGKK